MSLINQPTTSSSSVTVSHCRTNPVNDFDNYDIIVTVTGFGALASRTRICAHSRLFASLSFVVF
jgi:hypothetical protein